MNTFPCIGNTSDSGCVVYTGPAFPTLGIAAGDPLTQVLGVLGDKAQALSETQAPQRADKVVYAGKNPLSPSLSSCALRLNPPPFVQTWQRTSRGFRLVYDLTESLTGLPLHYYVTERSVSLVGLRGWSAQASDVSGALDFEGQLPASVRVEVKLSTPCGELRLSATATLGEDTTGDHSRSTLTVQDGLASESSTETNPSLQQLLEQIAVRLRDHDQLASRVRSLESQLLSVRNQLLAQQE